MAGIDKIYGTRDQCQQLYKWVKKHRPKALRYVYNPEWVSSEWKPTDIFSISNFPVSVDAWLARKCPLPFVLEALADQYVTNKISKIAQQRLTERMQK
jgi:hypothetical protein